MTLTLSQRLRVHAACTDRIVVSFTPDEARAVARAVARLIEHFEQAPAVFAEIQTQIEREERITRIIYMQLLAFACWWPLAVWGLLA